MEYPDGVLAITQISSSRVLRSLAELAGGYSAKMDPERSLISFDMPMQGPIVLFKASTETTACGVIASVVEAPASYALRVVGS
jgi:hypothetical protein